MSGEYFNYNERRLAEDIFGYRLGLNIDYGEDGWKHSTEARRTNVMEDREISEIVWDVLCLIYSYSYYKSGDTSHADYQTDIDHFKEKWFNITQQERTDKYKEDLNNFCIELCKELGDIKC